MRSFRSIVRRIGTACVCVAALAACVASPEVKAARHLDRGTKYFATGKYNEAIIELKNALKIDPQLAPALYHLGLAYKAKGWLPDAIRELQKVTAAKPEWTEGRVALGAVYVAIGDWDAALRESTEIRKVEPDNPQGLYLASAALKGKEKLPDALELISKAIRLNSGPPEFYLVQGDILARLNRREEAGRSYRAALQRDAKSADAHAGLGELLLAGGDRRGAESSFRQATTLGPSAVRPRLALAALYTKDRRYAEAQAELEVVPRGSRSVRVELGLAELHVKTHRYEEAIQLLQPLASRARDVAPLRLLLGQAYLGAGHLSRAIVELEKAVRLAPANPAGHFSLGVAHLRFGKPAEALAAFKRVGPPFAASPELLINTALAKFHLGRLGDSIADATAAAKANPRDVRAHDLLAMAHAANGNFSLAHAALDAGLQIDPNHAPARLTRARVYELERKPEHAREEFDKLLTVDPTNYAAVAYKANDLMREKGLNAGIRFVNDVLAKSPRDEQLNTLLAALYAANKDYRRAEDAFKTVLKQNKSFVPAQLGLGRLYLARGRDQEAEELLKDVLRREPAYVPALILLSNLAVSQQRYDPAIGHLEAAAKAQPDLPGLDLLLADLYIKKGRYEDAIALTERLLAKAPKHAAARLLLGNAYASTARRDEAVTHLRLAVESDPKSAEAHYQLARGYLLQGKVELAKKEYDLALNLRPQFPVARLERAMINQPPDPKAIEAVIAESREALRAEPKNPLLRFTVARAYLIKNDPKRAEAELRTLLDHSPGFVPAHLFLAELKLKAERRDDAVEALKQALGVNPGDLTANAMLSQIYASQRMYDQALKHLEQILRVNPNLLDVKLRAADLYGKTGRHDLGIRLAREVIAAHPNAAGAYLILGDLQSGKNQIESAIESFQKAVQLEPKFGIAHLRLGVAFDRQRKPDAAIPMYRKALALMPNDPVAHNNLAWLLATQKNYDEALRLARRAVELAPHNGEVHDTLGWILFHKADYAVAEQHLQKAIELLPRHSSVHFHLAMTQLSLGRKSEAASSIRRALQYNAKFEEADRAQQVLKEIGG